MNTAYCVKCRSKTNLSNSSISKTKNNRRILKGNCKKCKSKCCKFLKSNVKKNNNIEKNFSTN